MYGKFAVFNFYLWLYVRILESRVLHNGQYERHAKVSENKRTNYVNDGGTNADFIDAIHVKYQLEKLEK